MTELVTGFIPSKDELVRLQANPWRTYGEEKDCTGKGVFQVVI